MCRRFGVGEKELLDDLDLLFMCGVYPFTPDVLIDVDVADGRVWIRMADYFRRPLRLSPQEGLALVSAGSALLSVPGADPDGALATALAKLEDVLGVGAAAGFDVELASVTPAVLGAVRQAAGLHRRVDTALADSRRMFAAQYRNGGAASVGKRGTVWSDTARTEPHHRNARAHTEHERPLELAVPAQRSCVSREFSSSGFSDV